MADMLRGVLDGHVVLDRTIAERGRFPAVDVLRSVSRSLPEAATAAENAQIAEARRHLGAYDRAALMIRAGLYAAGTDPETDAAVAVQPGLSGFWPCRIGRGGGEFCQPAAGAAGGARGNGCTAANAAHPAPRARPGPRGGPRRAWSAPVARRLAAGPLAPYALGMSSSPRRSDMVLCPRGLRFAGRWFPAVRGRAGLTDRKREGDGATPRGTHRIVGLLYRPDRGGPPRDWALPIRPRDGWSDDVRDPDYNLSSPATSFGHERLWRPIRCMT